MNSSYIKKWTWIIGIIMEILLIIIAFLGYTLPNGQMSYWGTMVITNIITIIPRIGKEILEYIWGNYNIENETINRFYSLHYLLPFILVVLIIGHIITLHEVKGTNPIGVTTKKINFNPYFTIKDILGFIIIIISIIIVIGYIPFKLLHEENNIEANSLVTPSVIVPESYLLPYYAVLRSIEKKEIGVIVMLSTIIIKIILPYIQSSLLINTSFRKLYSKSIIGFIIIFILLGWIGANEVISPYNKIGLYLTISYFYMFIQINIISLIEYLIFFF